MISRLAVLDALRTCYDTENIRYTSGAEYIRHDQAVAEIEDIPSADVREYARGKWIHKLPEYAYGPDTYECSECMKVFYQEEADGRPYFNFCPNCGADMRKNIKHED